jgi:hypothetical protein
MMREIFIKFQDILSEKERKTWEALYGWNAAPGTADRPGVWVISAYNAVRLSEPLITATPGGHHPLESGNPVAGG